jgi:hypothetical protein
MYSTTITRSMPHASAWMNGTKPTWSFAMIEELLGALPPLEDIWASLPDPAALALLQKREQWLGVATLSCRSLSLLHELIGAIGVSTVIWRHTPSLQASEKQAILDARWGHQRVLVNKTLTIRLGTTHLLCTGGGDFTLHRRLLSAIATALHLPRRIVKDCHINPADYAPEYALGLLTGMVSPFMSPGISVHRLQAVIHLTETAGGCEPRGPMVAVSLSPCESLLLPLTHFRILTQMYARRAYPTLRYLEIDRQAVIGGGDRLQGNQIGDVARSNPHSVATHQTSSGLRATSSGSIPLYTGTGSIASRKRLDPAHASTPGASPRSWR